MPLINHAKENSTVFYTGAIINSHLAFINISSFALLLIRSDEE